MSENLGPKPSASKPGKNADNGTSAGTKDGPASLKSHSLVDPDSSLDFLAPAQAPGELGRLAHYRVLKVLGRGGMGIVFMAEDTKLHRVVALKVMLPSIATKAIARDRFIREARATAAIEHDHIVTIYEVSNEDSTVPFLAMQFLKGMTLEDWLKAGKRLNAPQIMRIGKEIAKALAAAHAHQLIHRDIKPSNIWLDAVNKGRVKILDFGLARPTNEETHLTQEGMILGSPAYMSPEQARGQNVDERCDLFSLGCVLYRLCAGKLPFAGKDAMSMLLSITADEPASLQQANDEMPAAFSELVHQLLAKKPEDRPASARNVVQMIQNIERGWIAGVKTSAVRPVRDAVRSAPDETIATAHDPVDPALEESAITDLEVSPTPQLDPAPPSPRNRSWIFAGLGCSMLSVLSIFCCLGIVMSTNHGSVRVTAEDDTAEKLLQNEGLTVVDHNDKAFPLTLGGPQNLPSGGYNVDLSSLPSGLKFEPNPFQMKRGETLTIKVHYVAPKGVPPIVLVTADQAKRLQQDWASYLNREVVETVHLGQKPGDHGMRLVLIPAGEFNMGSAKELLNQNMLEMLKKAEKKLLPTDYQKLVQSETPQHRVRITRPFYMSATEVTIAQFSRFRNAAGYITEPEKTGKGGTGLDNGREVARKREFNWLDPGYKPAEDYPVTNITMKDAEAFCAWLSNKEKKRYRLPTEAEWEYACRAGTTGWWSFGTDLRDNQARKYMWYHASFKIGPGNPATPKTVGKKLANGFGLFDMEGNVAEMCSDSWAANAYSRPIPKDGFVADPKGPPQGKSPLHVVRGGSFLDTLFTTRSAYRKGVDSSLGYATLGFRIVCEVSVSE